MRVQAGASRRNPEQRIIWAFIPPQFVCQKVWDLPTESSAPAVSQCPVPRLVTQVLVPFPVPRGGSSWSPASGSHPELNLQPPLLLHPELAALYVFLSPWPVFITKKPHSADGRHTAEDSGSFSWKANPQPVGVQSQLLQSLQRLDESRTCLDLCEVHAGAFLQHLIVPQKTHSAGHLIFPHPLLHTLLILMTPSSEGIFQYIALRRLVHVAHLPSQRNGSIPAASSGVLVYVFSTMS